MKEYPTNDDREELRELLAKYRNLKSGKQYHFIEEEAFEKLIDYFDDNEQLQLAIEAADCGIDQFPYSSLLMVKKADLLIADRKFTESLELLDRAEVLDNRDINIFILRIEAYMGLDQRPKAFDLLQEALRFFEGMERIEFLFEIADVFDDYEEFSTVFFCYKSILENDPSNQEALFKICFWTDYAEKYEESIELHQKLIDDDPYNHLAWFNLGTAFQGLKLYERAIDAYLYAIAINEKFDYAYRNLGDAYIRIGNYKEAIDALKKVLELSVPEDVIYEALGYCYEKVFDTSQARACYRKAIHQKPEDSHPYYRIAITYMNDQNYKSAIKYLETALSNQPDNPDYNFTLAQCFEMEGLMKQAIDHYLIYISSRSKNVKGWKAMISCLYKNGYYSEGITEAETAIYITVKPVFIYYKAAGLLLSGKVKEGLLWLESGLVKSPKLFKEFANLHPSLLQRSSVVRLANTYFEKAGSRKGRK